MSTQEQKIKELEQALKKEKAKLKKIERKQKTQRLIKTGILIEKYLGEINLEELKYWLEVRANILKQDFECCKNIANNNEREIKELLDNLKGIKIVIAEKDFDSNSETETNNNVSDEDEEEMPIEMKLFLFNQLNELAAELENDVSNSDDNK